MLGMSHCFKIDLQHVYDPLGACKYYGLIFSLIEELYLIHLYVCYKYWRD